jgi:hypothetical protein
VIPLFWQNEYALIQSPNSFFLGVKNDGRVLLTSDSSELRTWIVFDKIVGGVKSPCRATFGGFWSRDQLVRQEDVGLLCEHLAGPDFRRDISIYLPPLGMTEFDVVNQLEALANTGFKTQFVDVNYHIDVQSWSPSIMSKGNQKKLRQWKRAGGTVTQFAPSKLPELYEVIRLNRGRLGVEPSISLVDLGKLVSAFPQNYFLFGGQINNSIAVAAVVVQVSSITSYVFFWADAIEFRNYSPVVAICEEIAIWSKSQGLFRLDLGISSERGVLNSGLSTFKSNLGAQPDDKLMLLRT